MAEKNPSTIPAISLQPLNVEEIIEQVRAIERRCVEALLQDDERLKSLRTACAVLWGVSLGD